VNALSKRPIGLAAGVAALALVLPVGASDGSPPHPTPGGLYAESVHGHTTTASFVRPACNQLAGPTYDFSRIPDAPTVILSATDTGIPGGQTVCQITGYIAPQEQFRLTLPDENYNGMYEQEGCSSFCGQQLAEPPSGQGVGTQGTSGGSNKGSGASSGASTTSDITPSSSTSLLAANASSGCTPQTAELTAATGNSGATTTTQPQFPPGIPATAEDNEGHVGGIHDALWAQDDPALRVSFGYSSEHALAQAAKAIIAAYYGSPPRYSFYDGCSDGGREALIEAQRYPRDFNGILAGAPANIEAQLLGVVAAWVIEVNRDAQGHEILTSENLPALHAAVVRSCGDSNGLIDDPRSCNFDPASIQCPAGTSTPSCLTPSQVHVVRELYLGPNDGHGHSLYPGGAPYGSELAWSGAAIDPSSDAEWPIDTQAYEDAETYLKNAAYWTNPPSSFRLNDVSFTVASYNRLLDLAGLYDATDPDLSTFARAGGKIIIYQGWADQLISPFGTVDYYQSVVQHSGGFAASQQFSRLYMIPGQYHCLAGGSPAVSSGAGAADNVLLPALEDWVVHGTTPGTVSLPLAQPTATLAAITVSPLDPLQPPAGGSRGLNTKYHWVGTFRPGRELWCSTTGGTDFVCSHRTPAVSYSIGPSPKVGND
jgi:Tannase and feruloyl esterase